MKGALTVFIAFLFVSGCTIKKEYPPNDFRLGEIFEIKVGKRLYRYSDDISVEFVKMTSDSREKVAGNLIWQGNAVVELKFYSGDKPVSFTLNSKWDLQTDTLFEGFRISYMDLKPYPWEGSSFTQSDYRLNLLLEKEE